MPPHGPRMIAVGSGATVVGAGRSRCAFCGTEGGGPTVRIAVIVVTYVVRDRITFVYVCVRACVSLLSSICSYVRFP